MHEEFIDAINRFSMGGYQERLATKLPQKPLAKFGWEVQHFIEASDGAGIEMVRKLF